MGHAEVFRKQGLAAEGRCFHSLGLGWKRVNDKETETPAVLFYVPKKLPLERIPKKYRVPGSVRVSGERKTLATDVIEAEFVYVQASSGRRPPSCVMVGSVRAGDSVGHRTCDAGTLGMLVASRKPEHFGKVFALSNNHVFANCSRAQLGDQLLRPGLCDGGSSHFATLADFAKLPAKKNAPSWRTVDAALGELLPSLPYEVQLPNNCHLTGVAKPVERMRVGKYGRTTGYTEGIITDVNYQSPILYGQGPDERVAFFDRQIRIVSVSDEPFFAPGDSGSVIFELDTMRAVGLGFAHADYDRTCIANPIGDVLDALSIDLILPVPPGSGG